MFPKRVIEKTSRLRGSGKTPDPRDIEYLLDTVPFIRQYTEDQSPPSQTHQRYSALPPSDHEKSDPLERPLPPRHQASARVDSYVSVKNDSNAGHVYDQYMATVEGDEDAMNRVVSRESALESGDLCATCNTPLAYDPVEASVSCTTCGKTSVYFEGGARGLNYHEEVDHASKRAFTYKRISHFVECLNASQAKQNTSIPDSVIEIMHQEMKKYRMSPESVTSQHVRNFLKRRGLVKYYEHVNYILSMINHTKKTTLPKHVEETLIKMFIATQKPFESVTDSDRVNFLRYNYIIYKLLELIGETEYLHMFPLLKSRDKLIQHDQVWKRICEHSMLQWPFIPTI